MRRAFSIMLITASASSAGAQGTSGARGDPLVSPLAACRLIVDSAQRLGCFDKAAAGLTTALERGEVTLVTREQAAQTRRSLFGFAVPELSFLKRRSDEGELREIRTTIMSARQAGPGRHRLQVAEANGVWETTEALSREPQAGQRVRISRGALGSYWIGIDNQREVRGRRIR